MARTFGFAQLDFAGTLPLADGRYLARGPGDAEATGAAAGGGGDAESVLVVQTLGAPPPPRRRRRRARPVDPGTEPAELPLTRVTAIRAFAPFEGAEEAARWLDEAIEAEDTTDVLVADAVALLNRALHAQAVAAGDPYGPELTPERAVAARIGYGSGEQTAAGRFSAAREVDVWASAASRRRRRQQDLRPQELVAATLTGREKLGACDTLLLRARADLDAGRHREAALQLRVGLEALLVELRGALADPDHERDMATLTERRGDAGDAANEALRGELGEAAANNVAELLAVCERVLRRRRILRG